MQPPLPDIRLHDRPTSRAQGRGLRIAIVGCGPAGLAAALLLERQGHALTLLERFDAPQPVGSGIMVQPTGLAVLRELGLASNVQSLGCRIDRIRGLTSPRRKVVLDVSYAALGTDYHGIGIHRGALFDVLYRQVLSAGLPILSSTDVVDVDTTGDTAWTIDAAGSRHGPFDLVVDASGARSPLRTRSVGPPRSRELRYGALWGTLPWPGGPFDASQLEQRYVGAHTMIGVLPVGRLPGLDHDSAAFFWSIRTADVGAWEEAGLDAWKEAVRNVWPETDVLLNHIADAGQMTLARYGHATMRRPWGDRLVFIGDAAHATSPQLGQGANMALLDAWSLATALASETSLRRAIESYARARRWHVRAFQLSSLAMTPFYQSDSRVLAALRDLLFDPVSKLPVARRIVAGLISGLLAGPPAGLDYKPVTPAT